MDKMGFLTLSLVVVLGFGYVTTTAPENTALSDMGSFSDGENVSAPDENASAIDQVASVVDSFISPFVGLSSTNAIISIAIVIILAGLSYILSDILKDLVPFT